MMGCLNSFLKRKKAIKQILKGLSTALQCFGASLQQPWEEEGVVFSRWEAHFPQPPGAACS